MVGGGCGHAELALTSDTQVALLSALLEQHAEQPPGCCSLLLPARLQLQGVVVQVASGIRPAALILKFGPGMPGRPAQGELMAQ